MPGLLRNLATITPALFHQASVTPQASVRSWFRVTPFDVGIRTLTSDRYLQFAEAAQFDFLLRTGLMRPMLAKRHAFVNGAQLVKFVAPVRLFDRVGVDTRVLWADARWAWFEHAFSMRERRCAEVLVKMKFKRGRETIVPAKLLGNIAGPRPESIRHWDATLAALDVPR